MLPFFVLYHSKMDLFGFWIIGQTTQVFKVVTVGFSRIVKDIFHCFLRFYRPNRNPQIILFLIYVRRDTKIHLECTLTCLCQCNVIPKTKHIFGY